MDSDISKIKELVISRKDIDFSTSTVSKLKRNLIAQIEVAAKALCESPMALKLALENGLATVGSYESSAYGSWIYVHLNNHSYVIPYVRNH